MCEPLTGVEFVDESIYRRTVVIEGDRGALEVHEGGPGFLELRLHLPHWRGLLHLVQRARGIFNLDRDPRAAEVTGMRVPGAWDLFEVGVCHIVAQQAGLGHARRVMGRIVERHGLSAPGLSELGLTHTFPLPPALARADLQGVGLGKSHATAIQTFAGLVASDRLHLDGGTTVEEFLERTSAIPGLGSTVAARLAVRLGGAPREPGVHA